MRPLARIAFVWLIESVALVLAVGALLPGFAVSGLGDAVLASLILTAVNLVVSGLLAIDDDGSFYNSVIRRGARRMGGAKETDEPGAFMLEIDGLSEQSLRRAIDGGHVPTIARWQTHM